MLVRNGAAWQQNFPSLNPDKSALAKLSRKFLEADLNQRGASFRTAVRHVAREESSCQAGDTFNGFGRLEGCGLTRNGRSDGFIVETPLWRAVTGMLKIGNECTDESRSVAVATVKRRQTVDDDGVGSKILCTD